MFNFGIIHNSHLLCLCGIAAWLLVVVFGFFCRRNAGFVSPVLLGLGSFFVFCSSIAPIDTSFVNFLFSDNYALQHSSWVIDPLSRWFIAIIGILGVVTALFSLEYFEHYRHKVSLGHVWAAMALLFISMVGVVSAGNAICFLISWEIMALSSFALVATYHGQHSIRRAAYIYLGATRVGTAFLMIGFLWIYNLSGSWAFSDWMLSGTKALGPALLILVGLATKAGCWPFHIWLPVAHPAAPAPVSAVMSGVMIKTAIYTMARLFILGNHLTSPLLGPIILIFGAISAVWGVLFALLQHDLKRLLAYHSVENIGIIMMGLGLSIIGQQQNIPILAHLGLAAALFHSLNHAIFKALLFFSTGAVDAQTHERNAEHLGGLIHRMPWTAAAFIVGSVAICAIPPLNGFASEWLLYQGFFTLATQGLSIGARFGGLLLMGWLAFVGALAIACFVKAVGVVFLGSARSPEAAQATEVGMSMKLAQGCLAVFCVVLGVGVPLILNPLGSISSDLGGGTTLLQTAWNIPIAFIGLSLVVLLVAIFAATFRLYVKHPTRRYITWECGFGALGPRTQYTATSFAQPILRLFGGVYRYAVNISLVGEYRGHLPKSVRVSTDHEAYLETKIYGPLLRNFQRFSARFLFHLQAGSVHQYLFYIVITLVLMLWVGCYK